MVSFLSTAIALTSGLLFFQQQHVLAMDPQQWYQQHPGMSKIAKVDQNIHQIMDEFGRVRFFHGTNVVKKSEPWYRSFDFKPGDSFGLQDVQNLQRLGVNAVRLGHHWAGSEPVRGQYNQTFLNVLKEQTKLAEDHGIYILVDVHQDVLSSSLCGHGVPDWFVKSDWVASWKKFPFPQKLRPFKTNDKGIPSESDCNSIDWSLSYLSVAVGNAFGRLYNNYDNLGDAFASYWKKLAEQYVDTTNILGYNLLNEPWVGDTWADPTSLIPGVADHKNMEGLWNRASKQIRTVDNHTLIWFEGATYDILSGFNNVPLGDGSKTVHSFHYYKPPQLGSLSKTLENRQKDNKRLKTAGVMTEFTFWMGDDKQMADLQTNVNTADQYMVSWMGWAYENLYNYQTKEMYPVLAKHYSRAYPSAVAGIPTSFFFNPSDQSFQLEFTTKKSTTAPTELILPKPTYPNGYNVTFTPKDALIPYRVDDRTLALFTAENVKDNQQVIVTIQKK
ncbi:glycoside hydrolase superfamily [Cunninghamella echinulata]|nr:glycoside hydrolase superfamily [Cunninghamella echinulata]